LLGKMLVDKGLLVAKRVPVAMGCRLLGERLVARGCWLLGI